MGRLSCRAGVVCAVVIVFSVAVPAYPQAHTSTKSARVTTRSGMTVTISEPRFYESGVRSFYYGKEPTPAEFKQLRIKVEDFALCVPWEKVALLELEGGEARLQLVDGGRLTGTLFSWDPADGKAICRPWTWGTGHGGKWLAGKTLRGRTIVSGFPADYIREFEAIRSLKPISSGKQPPAILVVQDDRKEITVSDPVYITGSPDPLRYSAELPYFPLNVQSARVEVPLDQVAAILAVGGPGRRLTVRLIDGKELVGEVTSSLDITGLAATNWGGLTGYLVLPIESMAGFERIPAKKNN